MGDRMIDFVKAFGRGTQGEQIMKVYVGYKKFVEAWETPLGQHIMQDLMDQLRTLAGDIEKGDSEYEEHIKYNQLKEYADTVADKILTFGKIKEKVESKLKKT